MPRVQHIDHVAIAVSDLDRSKAWYEKHLGLTHRFADLWEGAPIMMGAGDTAVALFEAEDAHARNPTPNWMLHLAFRVDRAGFLEGRDELAAEGIAVREVEHENCRSLYFKDPDGHLLELTTYEIDGL